MYSSGSPEGGSDSSENRGEFLEKLQVIETRVADQYCIRFLRIRIQIWIPDPDPGLYF